MWQMWQPFTLWGDNPNSWSATDAETLALQVACLRTERHKIHPDWPDRCLQNYLWSVVEELTNPLYEAHVDDDGLAISWDHDYTHAHNIVWPIFAASFLAWLKLAESPADSGYTICGKALIEGDCND